MELFNKFNSSASIYEISKEDLKKNDTFSFLRFTNMLCYIVSGSLKISLEQYDYEIGEHDVLYIPKHFYINVKCNKDENIKVLFLRFTDDYLDEITNKIDFTKPSLMKNKAFYTMYMYPALYKLKELNKERTFKSYLINFLDANFDYTLRFKNRVKAPTIDPRKLMIINELNNHLINAIELSTLGERLNYNPAYLSYYFANAMNITLAKYYTLKRMTLARELFLKGYSPHDVSTYLGFDTYSTFYRKYKQIFNLKPTDKISFDVKDDFLLKDIKIKVK